MSEKQINVTLTYPNSKEYEFISKMEIIDLDQECKNDISSGRGFLISSPKASIKKDIKNPDGIYSEKFGRKIGDDTPYVNQYACENGIDDIKIKYHEDDFKRFAWIVLKDQYHIIHPKFYDELDYLFGSSPFNYDKKRIKKGSKLKNILNYSPEVDQNGTRRECEFKPDNEPFFGIGMIAFYERFDEILEYYYKKNPKKQSYYDEIVACREQVFCHSIPVFTTHLRPADIKDGYMYYEKTNGIYNMISKHVHSINNDKRKINRDIKVKNNELFNVQMEYMKLVDEVMEILSGKRGRLRMLIGGRYNFSCRAVIRQDSSLRIDQVKLPYVELVKCLQQRIINILMRTYNISPSEAYEIWSKALAKKDERVAEIIDAIIHAEPEGLPVIINRNPTINYGSILQVFCVGYTDTLTMSLSLQVLKPLCADFDGDVLNIFHIINKAFFERAYVVFNPRNAMYISRVNGKLNNDVLIQRDTLINANTFIYLGRHNYSQSNIEKIKAIKEKQKAYYLDDTVL